MVFSSMRFAVRPLPLLAALAACTEPEPPDQTPDEVIRLSCAEVEAGMTLTDHREGLDYIINCLAFLTSELVIEPGVSIEFEADAGIAVDGDGVLYAVGTATAGIELVGSESARGHWRGLYFGSDHDRNRLAHVLIRDAGGDSFNSNDDRGGIVLYAGGGLSLTDSTIRGSAAYGLTAYDDTRLSFTNNTITDNTLAPLDVPLSLLHELDAASSLNENDIDYVDVNSAVLTDTTGTWQALSVPYRAVPRLGTGLFLDDGSMITIAAGAQWAFEADGGIAVRGTGSLTAVGTVNDPIEFDGTTDERGWWSGLNFESESPNNRLEHVIVRNAGGQGWSSNDYRGGVVVLGHASIHHSAIHGSASFGLHVYGDFNGNASLSFSDNTITENTGSPLYLPGAVVHEIDDASVLLPNDDGYARIYDTNLFDTTATWKAIGTIYLMEDLFTIEPSSSLTLEAGVSMHFAEDAGLRVYGSLTAIGDEQYPIGFRGRQAQAGYWRGILIGSDSASNQFDYVEIAHAGSTGFSSNDERGGIVIDPGARITLSNTTISQTLVCGLFNEYPTGEWFDSGGNSLGTICLPPLF